MNISLVSTIKNKIDQKRMEIALVTLKSLAVTSFVSNRWHQVDFRIRTI